MTRFDLEGSRSVHVVGIGGAGMSGIASVLARMGHRVSGSDLKDSTVLERLRAQGMAVSVGHTAGNLPVGVEAVVVSTAIPERNPEVVEARERGVPVLRRAEALALLAAVHRTVAVSGTHGKTTTTSMLTLVLRQAGWRPTFLIGGDVNEVGGNAGFEDGGWLVVEADESDGTFLELDAEVAVVTNLEPDHLEHYGSFDALVEAFGRFVSGAQHPVVAADDRLARSLVEGRSGAVSFGFADDATYRVTDYAPRDGGVRFELRGPGGRGGPIELAVPGRHHVLDAAAAAATALELGVEFDEVAAALGRFTGVARRFQFRGHYDGVTVVDDYAHLPSEIRAAVSAAREGGWERVVAVFQPHRYSRTATLWRDFGDAFSEADVVVLTDVYAAGEAPRPGVSGRLILRAVLDSEPSARVVYLPHRADVERVVPRLTRAGDVVLTLGAGDITSVADVWVGP